VGCGRFQDFGREVVEEDHCGPGYAVILLLIAGGLFGGAMHVLVTNVLGLPGLVLYLKVGPWVNALGPPYVATDFFLALVYILNARASTFLLGVSPWLLSYCQPTLGESAPIFPSSFPFERI